MSSSPSSASSLRVEFGQAETRLGADARGVLVSMKLPHLAGPRAELILETDGVVESPAAGSRTLTGGDWLAGAFVRPLRGPVEELALAVYRELLLECRGWSLARVWNYVPDINGETTGLENYRRFNLGRWQAFHDAFGDQMHAHLPAASAVGLCDEKLVVIFLATRQPVRLIENPDQVPAWRYPQAYGPKAPSFVRGSVVGSHAWISGTASIKGHESIGLGDLATQTTVTLENLATVLRSMDMPPLQHPRHRFKVYLRRGADAEPVRAALHAAGLALDGAVFLEADICRRELDLEIELSCD